MAFKSTENHPGLSIKKCRISLRPVIPESTEDWNIHPPEGLRSLTFFFKTYQRLKARVSIELMMPPKSFGLQQFIRQYHPSGMTLTAPCSLTT